MIILVIPSPFEVQGMSKRLPISKRNDIFTHPIKGRLQKTPENYFIVEINHY